MTKSTLMARVHLLQAVFNSSNDIDITSFIPHLEASKSGFDSALSAWQKEQEQAPLIGHDTQEQGAHLRFVNSLADVTDNNISLIMAIRTRDPHAMSLRDVALTYNLQELTELAASAWAPSAQLESGTAPNPKHIATGIRRKLFLAEPTSVLRRMIEDDEIPFAPATHHHVHRFLAEDPAFDIRRTSVLTAMNTSNAFDAVPDEHKPAVVEELRKLQRVQALTPVPEAIMPLMKHNLTSALHIASISQEHFVRRFTQLTGDETVALSIHQHATASKVRNENFLVSALQTVRGSGLRVIDGGAGKSGVELRRATFDKVAGDNQAQVNLEQLFGSLDYCECSDCTSVYSPASYFVELLEFLRHNNLDPDNSHTDVKGYKGTQLEQLLLRRPDLACIQLTCENTNTLIPYIDLALEVMESYVVHAPLITAYNVRGETSSELLAAPQHTNLAAYDILRESVYPFRLPYNFAIDTTRVYLSFLKTTRAEILRVFQPTAIQKPSDPTPTQEAVQRAADAEFNLITQEEYVILTKQAFWNIAYYECRKHRTITPAEYAKLIGVKKPWEYYGYANKAEMSDNGGKPKLGLMWVKAQFLKRTGILYTDLVSLLLTRYINPSMPTGKALVTMEMIRFSYRFLQRLVQTKYKDKRRRFEKLIAFLSAAQPLIPLLEWAKKQRESDPCAAPEDDDGDCGGGGKGGGGKGGGGKGGCGCGCSGPSKSSSSGCCSSEVEWKCWVYDWFEKIGGLIVLESGEGPQIPIRGRVWAEPQLSIAASADTSDGTSDDSDGVLLGTLGTDGAIIADNGSAVAYVSVTGTVISVKTGKNLSDSYPNLLISVYANDDRNWEERKGYIRPDTGVLWVYLTQRRPQPVQWSSTQDTCDIEKVRLLHLDGTSVTPAEYDRMQRFLRLWSKMGWTIEETDDALTGLGKDDTSKPCPGNSSCDEADMDDIDDEDEPPATDISVHFIHQLVSVKKLIDITGFPLPVLLTFWSDMPTRGDKSLYATTFLTHNLVSMDPVFRADADGNFLTDKVKLTDHLPILQAALGLKAEDIALIRQLRSIPDELTLSNVSELYRFSKLAKFLQIRPAVLPDIVAMFGEPFTDADTTLGLLETWAKINDSAFTFPQLNYIIRGVDNLTRPLSPTMPQILRITKTIMDGLADLNKQQSDVGQADIDEQRVTLSSFIPAKLAMIYSPALAGKINDFISGTYLFTTNAPRGLTITPEDTLAVKLKYVDQKDATPPKATLNVTGILTVEEVATAKGLSANPNWAPAVDRIVKQAATFYKENLSALFPADGAATLLKGDTPDTPLEKGLYFLKYFMPFLRAQLATQLVQTTISSALGVAPNITAYLLSDVVKSSDNQSALSVLLGLQSTTSSGGSQQGWKGYIIPSTTDAFTFTATSETKPADIMIDGKSVPFPHQSEDPSDLWSSDPVKMVAGTLYFVELSDRLANELQWRTATTPASLIPASALLPALSSDAVAEVFTGLVKVSLLLLGFNLTLDEVVYFHGHGADFAAEDGSPLKLDALTLGSWKRLQAYAVLRGMLPKQPTRLIDLFSWATEPDTTPVEEYINRVTVWDSAKVKQILTHYNAASPAYFKNELVLVQLQLALSLVNKTQIDVDKLFEWAKPLVLSDKSYQILQTAARDLKNAIRARYNASDWEQAVKPLNDTLRKNQRDALVAYLIVEESLVATGKVFDADGLFEYFLIDVQMSSCLQTSRIKQAIATIQLYVQRCLLGLEDEIGVNNDRIDRKRWNWMKRYVLWQANRQVYLYPENWIVPSLRDDKSPFFLDLESTLLQKDISLTNVAESLKGYLYKVSEVANLKVYGLFVDVDKDNKESIQIVARRMNAPYDWYSRGHSADGYWSPWVAMPVDIPNCEVEDENGNIVETGALIAPTLWQGQPIIFFLQMARKSIAYKDANKTAMGDRFMKDDADHGAPTPVWEIKLGYSMFRNGKWTPKQVSQAAIRDIAPSITIKDPKDPKKEKWLTFAGPLPNQAAYQVVPRTGDDQLQIDVVFKEGSVTRGIGHFIFMDGHVLQAPGSGTGPTVDNPTLFHYITKGSNKEIYTLQAGKNDTPPYFEKDPRVQYSTGDTKSIIVIDGVNITFNHTFVDSLLRNISDSNSLDDLFTAFADESSTASDDPFGKANTSTFNELRSPYGLFNWELGLHAPMLLIDGLLKAQQFDDALNVCHYIFDPSAEGADGNKKYWNFFPFKALADTDAKQTLEQMFLALKPQKSDDAVTNWRNNPFAPHSVARMRPVAYMKWITMKYIEILIAYGDYYFRQNSLETIPNAIQCYVIASHVYGPRGQKIPKRGKTAPETYSSLLNRWDAFGNAVVQLEVAFPFSNQTPLPIGSSNGITGFANIFGFATSLYFCLPSNPKLMQLRDTIDDRLYKIRNCMDINGIVRQLPLFDPLIDPGLLVQATAQGLNLDTVLNDLSGPLPNFRFNVLLQKALELCGEVKSLGSGILSIKEKKDGEVLQVLRAKHETNLSTLTLDIKLRAVNEANATLEGLLYNRISPSYRHQFYKQLAGLTDPAPAETSDFQEIPNPSVEAPSAEGELLLISPEKEEVKKSLAAQNWSIGVGSVEALASILHLIPDTTADGKPFGVGLGIKWGGTNLAYASGAVARGLQIYAAYLSSSSGNARRKGELLRQLQDRIFQANSTGYELKNIDKQITTQRIRVSTTEQELKNQQTMLDQVQEVEDFLRSKYTNEELYTWMEGLMTTSYYQAYTLAFDLAKRAEKAFKFERPQNSIEYIRYGYWNGAHDGLLAGEQLFLGLKALEAAYQENLGHDFEMIKHVSIRQWAPLSLLEFRETGSFELSLPEILFDMDCPGHYMRRIISVAVTIPCIVGPYTSINCTLRLMQSSIRTSPRATGKNDYPQTEDEEDDRFSAQNCPITSIVLSSAQNDMGRHELSLTDRYNPFEGAGVISKWRFELPSSLRMFDYSTITDVIMHIKYTSIDGGDKLKQAASDTVLDYVKSMQDASQDQGLFTVFDLKNEFSSEWYAAFRTPNPNPIRELALNNLANRLPIFTKMWNPSKIIATSMAMLGRGPLSAPDVQILLQPDGSQVATFKPGIDINTLVGLTSEGLSMPVTSWKLQVSGQSVAVENLWLVVRYSLT